MAYPLKSKRKKIIFLVLLGISLISLSSVIIYITLSLFPQESNQKAYYYLNSAIYIDDSIPDFGWKTIVEQNHWCTGNGMLDDPYIIENIFVNVDNEFNCIEIRKSNAHFIIRNSKFSHLSVNSNTGEGIRLSHVKNGLIFNNVFTKSWTGISIVNSNNNTIS
ncbi:MAG: hypothetical protein ACW99L_13100, partial [Promethearchaeota archaeon]